LRKSVAALVPPVHGDVRVSYGVEHLPAPGAAVAGGIVKFQRLQAWFPHHPFRFNVLYLGSSSLPADVPAQIDLARRRGAGVLLNQNGVAYPAWAGSGADVLNARLREALREADHVLYQSAFCKACADRALGEAPSGGEILYNAVDTQTFRTAPAPDGPPILLLAGNQLQPYRLEVALRTLHVLSARRPETRLLVTGTVDPGARDSIDALGLRGRIELIGQYTQRDAPAIYGRAHVLLHTKVSDPCPNVVLEALATGVPVVYPRSGGTPELVGDEAGIGVVDASDWEHDVPPDPEALADAVDRVLDALPAYREAARRRAEERFDLQPWVARHREVFAKLAR
jgi:glycosyltransferase involved in cell wall biosynthesis